MKKEEYIPLIRETLREVDFDKIHAYMDWSNWDWGPRSKSEAHHVPTIGELYQTAERLLVQAAEKECMVASGGFSAFSDGKSVEICFSIAEGGCTAQDLEN